MNNKERVIRALKNNKVSSVEFCSDGSCVMFNFWDPTADHGCPCTMGILLKPEEALECLRGFRMKQHELETCF